MAEETISSQPGGADSTSAEAQGEDRRKRGFSPSEDEKKVVKHYLDRLERAEKDPKREAWKKQLEEDRGYVAGTVHKEKGAKAGELVRTNMVYATIAAQMPELYAKNPTIAVTPTDAVADNRIGLVKKFCATAEKVIRKSLVEEGRLKKRAKSNIRATSNTGYGVLKMLFQKQYHGDPVIVRRIEDSQDNLARIEMQMKRARKEDDPGALALLRDSIKANIESITKGNEVKMWKGFVIDRMRSEDFVILDESIVEFDEYVSASALAHLVWMTVSDAMARFRMEDLPGATRYNAPYTDVRSGDTPADEQFICVVEVWDKQNGVVRTTAKGMNRWLEEPYAPTCTPQRWYPFYVLGFNVIEGRWRPISDVELLKGLQDEYNQTRTNFADARERCVPVIIVRKTGGLVEEDVKRITNRGNKDTILVEGNPAVPISQDVMFLEVPKIDPMAYDVTMVRNDMDLVIGRSDASRANLIKPKTATEAEIMQEAMQSRIGERRDTHEDLLSEMGEAGLEISLKEFSKDEVKQMAGEEAEWPESPPSAEMIFNEVSCKVKAGSSGKPNQQKEREQWTQLMPVVEKTMTAVGEMRAMGNYDGAEAAIELLRETLRRFDESLDLDALIPPTEKDEKGRPIVQQQAALELVKCKEQLALCQEELAKCQEELQKAKAGEAVAIEKEQTARELAAHEADQQRLIAQHQSDEKVAAESRAAEVEKERLRLEDERAERELEAKIASEEKIAQIKADAEIEKARISAGAQKEIASEKNASEQKNIDAKNKGESENTDKFAAALDGLQTTVKELSKGFQQLAKESAERSKMIKEHLDG